MIEQILAGRTAVVTGAAAGLGRAEALSLAAHGADVVVNDLDPNAAAVVDEIVASGARAVAVVGDIGAWDMGRELVDTALATFGRLDIVVNNAGIIRDRMVFNLTETDWETVLRVHLTGHAALSQAATAHWRAASKSAGNAVYGRIVNTSSEAFLLGAVAAPNYAAAKAGITALTVSTARAMSKYGVTANAICPRARTQMTADALPGAPGSDTEEDLMDPDRVATFVTYLASPAAAEVTGQVFVVYADFVALMAPPTVEYTFVSEHGRFTADELADVVTDYFVGRPADEIFASFAIKELDRFGAG
jgi:3-oxoacyl-[acyl-carrier protein] reductase